MSILRFHKLHQYNVGKWGIVFWITFEKCCSCVFVCIQGTWTGINLSTEILPRQIHFSNCFTGLWSRFKTKDQHSIQISRIKEKHLYIFKCIIEDVLIPINITQIIIKLRNSMSDPTLKYRVCLKVDAIVI